jgi:hypothetical protein
LRALPRLHRGGARGAKRSQPTPTVAGEAIPVFFPKREIALEDLRAGSAPGAYPERSEGVARNDTCVFLL